MAVSNLRASDPSQTTRLATSPLAQTGISGRSLGEERKRERERERNFFFFRCHLFSVCVEALGDAGVLLLVLMINAVSKIRCQAGRCVIYERCFRANASTCFPNTV